jgi:hypothetical protein
MRRFAKVYGLAPLAGLVLLTTATPSRAQGNLVNNPYQNLTPVFPSDYYGYTGDPYGGLLRGAAAVIRSQGQFALDQQNAVLIREQIISARIDNRRKKLEQWLWERENLPTPQDQREWDQRQEFKRALTDPPVTEIWSGKALNTLLYELGKIYSAGQPGGDTPLNPEQLKKINVTSDKAGGNIGLIRSGRLRWPMLLLRPEFDGQRNKINQLLAQLLNPENRGQVDPRALEEVIQSANEMSRHLSGRARELGDKATWTPTQFVEARSFLNQFDDAIRVLMQPDAAAYLTGQYSAQGKTAFDLIKHMKYNGLRFAPATPGDEAAYRGLHAVLVDYATQAGVAPPPSKK